VRHSVALRWLPAEGDGTAPSTVTRLLPAPRFSTVGGAVSAGGLGGRSRRAVSAGGLGGRLRWAASVGGLGGRSRWAVSVGGLGGQSRWAASVGGLGRLGRSVGTDRKAPPALEAHPKGLLPPRLGRPAPFRARPRAERLCAGLAPTVAAQSDLRTNTFSRRGRSSRVLRDRSRRAEPSRGGRRQEAFLSPRRDPRRTRTC
jgi:hypothetical protein